MRKTLKGEPIEVALNACFELIRKGDNTQWELDKWYSEGTYDFNIVKPYGKSYITVRKCDQLNNSSKLIIKCEIKPDGFISWKTFNV